ncbi:hypothetical protein PspLS_04339 [Pyricularia sp. CBS 133598]|nr:hypothetical protein PspLS_04339 [Pyricularia sp. CBS 133598]
MPRQSGPEDDRAVPSGREATDQQASKINTITNLIAHEDNGVDHVQAHQEQSLAGSGCADDFANVDVGKVRDNDASLLQDRPAERGTEEESMWQSQFPSKLAVAMRAPWNMDVAKASRLSKAQWLQAHEAILLQCGFLVCLDGHADEPRDTYHPITPKYGAATDPPEFYRVQELHDYLVKQSMPLAVQKICQRASPSLYAATYPVDALGLPTQPSLPEVDDIDDPEVIIHLQVPFVALALVLQQHVKLIHNELSFELDPIPGLQKHPKIFRTRGGPRMPKETTLDEEQIAAQAVPRVAGGMQMGREPTKEFAAITPRDLELARKLIPINDHLDNIKKGTASATYRNIENSNLVSTRHQVALSTHEPQSQKHKRKGREAMDVTKLAKRVAKEWVQRMKEASRQERPFPKAEEAARNKRLADRNTDLAGFDRREERILRRLAKSKDWLERSRVSDDLVSRIQNLNELLGQAIREGNGNVDELDFHLTAHKELRAIQEKESQKASQSVQGLEAELAKLRESRACLLQEYESATNGDFDRNAWATKNTASSPLTTHKALKGESSTQQKKRKAEDTEVTPAAAHDRFGPQKRARH